MAVGLKLFYDALELAIMSATITSSYAGCTESAVVSILSGRGEFGRLLVLPAQVPSYDVSMSQVR